MAPASRCTPVRSLQEGRRAVGTCTNMRVPMRRTQCTVLVGALPVQWRSARAGRQSETFHAGRGRRPSRWCFRSKSASSRATGTPRCAPEAGAWCGCCGAVQMRTGVQWGGCAAGPDPFEALPWWLVASMQCLHSSSRSAHGMREHPGAEQRAVQLQRGAGAVALQRSCSSAPAPLSAVPAVTGGLRMAHHPRRG